jgi:hypothetical protein
MLVSEAVASVNVVPFDRSALKTNQLAIVVLTVAAFVTQVYALVAVVALIMLAGTIDPRLALFQQLYRQILKPSGLVKPRIVTEDPAPHRFAQGLGGVVLALGALALYIGQPTLGWLLAWLVIALAFVNLVFDFCVGCQMYFLLARAGFMRTTR